MVKKTEEEKKAEAREKINALIQKANDAIQKATEIADEHEIIFDYHPDGAGTYHPRELIWAASDGCEWETSDEWSDAHWKPGYIDWDASSC